MTLLGHLLTHLPLEYSWLRPTLSEGRRERASGLGARARGERWASRGAVLRPRTRGISVEHARPSAWHTAGRRERQASGGAASACRAPRARPDGARTFWSSAHLVSRGRYALVLSPRSRSRLHFLSRFHVDLYQERFTKRVP